MDLLAALRLFDRAVARRSFSRAARDLDVSPATVTRAVQALELRYGVELLRRSTRGMTLTEAGLRLRIAGSELLAGEAALGETITGTVKLPLSGTLRVTAPSAFGVIVVAPMAARFTTDHPGVFLDLLYTDRYLDLVAENVDLALRVGTLSDSTLVQRRIARLPEVLVAAPSYLDRAGAIVAPERLDEHAFVGLSILRQTRPTLTLTAADGRVVTVETRKTLSFDTPLGVQAALLAGGGIGRIHRYLVDSNLAAGRLVPVLPGWFCPTWDMTLVATARGRSRIAEAFTAELEKTLISVDGLEASS